MKVIYNRKVYRVRIDTYGKKYIISQKQKVYISTIHGKYRYVRKLTGGRSIVLDLEGGLERVKYR